MIERIFGLETEFGITFNPTAGRALSAEEIARYLFRKVVAWGRSSNVFLGNGARLYLDVGSHPEYASAECDDIRDLLIQDKAGERIMCDLIDDAHERLAADGIEGTIHLFKNNVDSAGNSFGCHENYLIRRRSDFGRTVRTLIPFLITRQILTGAGHVIPGPGKARYALSQRADYMWDATSSATTRSRPIINTRDEPHADADTYRRLHVISGDSSISQTTTMLKIGMTDIVLRMLEAGVILRDFTFENPVRAIRQISHDITATAPVPLVHGAQATALQIQRYYLDAATEYVQSDDAHRGPHDAWVLDLWRRGLDALDAQDLTPVETELDWVIKKRLVDRYVQGHNASLTDPRISRLLLAYHDISPAHGLINKLQDRGLAATLITDDEAKQAMTTAPQTTRAKLRGDFVTAATRRRRDFTVDWVHMKLNDFSGRTVLCKDPFAATDERVDRLIASIEDPEPPPATR